LNLHCNVPIFKNKIAKIQQDKNKIENTSFLQNPCCPKCVPAGNHSLY
jgi:hypothetical protein